jgi:hypothetical protein
MALPAAAEAARAAAAAKQRTRNLGGAFVIGSFIAGVFFYVTRAVGQDQITAEEVEAFRAKRKLEQAANAKPQTR